MAAMTLPWAVQNRDPSSAVMRPLSAGRRDGEQQQPAASPGLPALPRAHRGTLQGALAGRLGRKTGSPSQGIAALSNGRAGSSYGWIPVKTSGQLLKGGRGLHPSPSLLNRLTGHRLAGLSHGYFGSLSCNNLKGSHLGLGQQPCGFGDKARGSFFALLGFCSHLHWSQMAH